MELINATRILAGYSMSLEPSARELLVVVVKATFSFPAQDDPNGHCALHEEQLPLVMADTFTGEPGLSAPVYEVDFVPRKSRCDVLLLGSAYAPLGRPATRVEAGLRVGGWSKVVAAIGPRHWECGLGGASASFPGVFVRQPISYDVAFGGTDLLHDDPSQHAAFLSNPVGRGFHKHIRPEWVDGKPLPCIEAVDDSVRNPGGSYRPMAFGPLGRSWDPRRQFAGTYDDRWLDEQFPFLPSDFDNRYYQSAPLDQQVPLAQVNNGPIDVVLANLTPEGVTSFQIPHMTPPVHVFPKHGTREDHVATLDTIVIEPDKRRFSLAWRVVRPLKRSMFEIAQVLVGRQKREWWQQRGQVSPDSVQSTPITHSSASAEA